VYWHSAPAYKVSKLFTQKINIIAPLLNTFNIKNTKVLIQKLQDTPISPHFTFASLDITNLYSNIPVTETRTILANILKHNLTEPQTWHELLKWYDIITRQNYFNNNQDIIIQYDGLVMGATSSSIIAEIFLKHTEYTHMAHLTHKHNIINYFCYMDDILLILDPKSPDPRPKTH
jgi:hypothetical protein